MTLAAVEAGAVAAVAPLLSSIGNAVVEAVAALLSKMARTDGALAT